MSEQIPDSDIVCTTCYWRGGHDPKCPRATEPWPTISVTDTPRDGDAERLSDEIVRDVCELPDRTSPEDAPDAIMATWQELRGIVVATLEPVFDARDAAMLRVLNACDVDMREKNIEIERLKGVLRTVLVRIDGTVAAGWLGYESAYRGTLADYLRESLGDCVQPEPATQEGEG